MRRHSDRGTGHEDHEEDPLKELYANEYVPRDAEAGGVLLFDEAHVAEQEQHAHRDPDRVEYTRRLGIPLHVGPARAAADVGAVARVEACAPSACGATRRAQG